VSFSRYAPDGTRIAYIAQDSLRAPWQLAIISTDGATERRYGFCFGSVAPLWSPDSKLVAYSDGTDLRLRVVELVSGQVIQVDPAGLGFPGALWLSNTRLVYHSAAGRSKPQASHHRWLPKKQQSLQGFSRWTPWCSRLTKTSWPSSGAAMESPLSGFIL